MSSIWGATVGTTISPEKIIEKTSLEERVNRLSMEISDLGSVPNYIVVEAERVVNSVQSTRNATSLVFPVMTDFHLKDGDSSKDDSLASAKNAGMGIKEMAKRIHLDFVGLLGDYSYMSSTAYTVEQVKKDIMLTKKALGLDVNEVWGVGNHDLNYGTGRDRRLTDDELYSFIGVNSDGVKPSVNIERGYGYLDFETQKIRVINLNTCDASDWEGTWWNTTEGRNAWAEWISPTQIQWLADIALDFSDKENASEWGIVILGHHSLHYGYDCFADTMKILEAYKNETSGSLQCKKCSDFISSTEYRDWVYETVTYDFTSGGKAEIICNIHGHNHNCAYSQISSGADVTPWLWRLCVPNICVGRENESATYSVESSRLNRGEFDSSGNPVYYYKEKETAKATSFNIVSIDRKNKMVYAYIFGAGIDREFNYTSQYVPETPSNLLDVSTRTYSIYETPTFIENTDTREIDYTKCYAVDANGRRGEYPSGKFSNVTLDENGLTATCNSRSGYGIEFPINVEPSKTYVLEKTETSIGKVMLITFNSDGTLKTTSTIRPDENNNQFTTEEGYKYSISFHWGAETKTISDISVKEI